MISWFDLSLLAITIATNCLQFYVLWLVLRKSPRKIHNFRFALYNLLGNEVLFTASIGYVLCPELLFEYDRAALVNGLARYLGQNGGKIGFSMALFFGAGVFWSQVYCLLFRFTAIQQRYDQMHKKFNRWPCRLLFMCIGYAISTFCGIVAWVSLKDNQVSIQQLHAKGFAFVGNDSVILLLGDNDDAGVQIFGFFILGGFTFASVCSICFSSIIYRTIQANAGCFTARTFKLHRQLTLLLIVQFCLPIFFLIAPCCLSIASVIFLFHLDKLPGDISLLLLSLYTMANSLSTVVFIAPYREHALRLLRLGKNNAEEEAVRRLTLKTTVMPIAVEKPATSVSFITVVNATTQQ